MGLMSLPSCVIARDLSFFVVAHTSRTQGDDLRLAPVASHEALFHGAATEAKQAYCLMDLAALW